MPQEPEGVPLFAAFCPAPRHSFVSIGNDLGFAEVQIVALVGRAQGSVTSKYIHTLDTALIVAADTIAGYIEGLLDGQDSSN